MTALLNALASAVLLACLFGIVALPPLAITALIGGQLVGNLVAFFVGRRESCEDCCSCCSCCWE